MTRIPSLPEPKRPQRESWGMELAIALSALATLGVLMVVGVWLLNWASKPVLPQLPEGDQDPIVSKFRHVGFEIGRNAENEIQVITTPNPLLVTDKDLALVTGLPNLTVLDLRGTQITDDALAHLTGLPKIEQLYVGGSVVTDTEPTLFHARFTDDAIKPLVELSTLKVLSLAKTDLGDKAIQQLPQLANLEVLFLLGTNVSDDSLDALAQMTSLKELYLQETKITPEGLKKLRTALPETKILPHADAPTEPSAAPE
ncbi:hypothetical protein DTL42_08775 [Bremerella cremea]|uniref:Leucine-rich repeat domain-containing protein n=1 Tax=Bremerella cremea TaxID=1031537 RepID=A0A368KX13_9BACT|nr:hypothetical protein [Bremerella cremea]RCS52909.1 hypothetical protein DTL42_08775 [Bremerella cremea]